MERATGLEPAHRGGAPSGSEGLRSTLINYARMGKIYPKIGMCSKLRLIKSQGGGQEVVRISQPASVRARIATLVKAALQRSSIFE